MTTPTAISVRNLTKTYRDVHAVTDISFDVEAGSVFAFLGTNGAGKSTTIGCITTVQGFDSGSITVLGHEVSRNTRGNDNDGIRHQIGVVFQASVLDPLLTVTENLVIRAAFYGLSRADARGRIRELAELIGLTEVLGRRYGTLSGGQKRRADIARALIHRPAILFLDEPTAGLDPQSREKVWDTIRTLRETQGITVFLTTHYMEETERADEVCIVTAGRIAVRGTATELRSTYSHSVLSLTTTAPDALSSWCAERGLPATTTRRATPEAGREIVHTIVAVTVETSSQAIEVLTAHESIITNFEFRHGTMDDVFLAVTGDAPSATAHTPSTPTRTEDTAV
ncbi:ATP-binding cassette domain-containing protein [Klugiella xanthotipulae]|uniref:Multidrug/hemolysin transport system ATP-binding protein n=1 Tax=Klugiella xanthotipulae TaxID=244735 RepID=A0A543I5M2_9MICO|nr:ABC transporter ATP-binding protein [Klugiella xanthotipulae]TQM65902.1 multidrug/hemolysin transport system ATP-binding protein [Klugiella xanthotipulae]